MSKLFEKIIALIMVIILMSANLLIIGEFTIAQALSDEELNEQTSKTNQKNVEFNSYFYGQIHNQTFDIGSEEAKIYLKIVVNNAGYVDEGTTVEFQNANFKIKDGITNENIKSVDTANNKITLNKIDNGSNVEIEVPIEILEGENVSLDYFAKETTTKLSGTYVDGEGERNTLEKEVVNKLSWKGTAEAEIKVEATKYIPYIVDGIEQNNEAKQNNEEEPKSENTQNNTNAIAEVGVDLGTGENTEANVITNTDAEKNTGKAYGVMVQTKVNSNVKNSSLPIKNTQIETTAPEINNTKPTSVTVIANSTQATNGKTDGIEFTNSNYSYDINTGKVTINTANLQDSISWKKNVTDEYIVTYMFESKEAYDFVIQNGIESKITAVANLSLYNNEETKITAQTDYEIKYTEKVGEMTDFEAKATNDISKGYVYANYDAKNKTETEYYTDYIATIYNAKLTTSLEFAQSYDKFLTEEEAQAYTTVDGKNYSYNKRIEISQAIFNKILGEDGEITVKDSDGKELGKINKDTAVEDGKYKLDISSSNNNKLVITTTAPITEGQIELRIVKALKGEIDYSKTQMQSFKKIKTELKGSTNVKSVTKTADIALKEPETKVELQISKPNLTTVLTNENVEIRAVLDTSSVYNGLFKNPTLKIKLPSYIKKINLKGTNILLGNGLKLKDAKLVAEDGQAVIVAELEGNQTEYAINAEYKGAIIVFNTDLTTDTLTPSGKDKITMEYTNENEVATKTKGTVSAEITYVAPSGVVTANGVSNYKDGAEDVLSISEEPITLPIDTYSDERTTTIEGTVINNYNNDISKISILGRIPAQGNTQIDTNNEMGSTFSMPLATQVELKGVDSKNYTVYYSDNANASKDLQDASNGWSTTARTSSKSYLIVFNDDYKMKPGTKIDISYDMVMPENLTPDNDAYTMYKVYYTNDSEIGQMVESKTSSVIGFSTGEGPEAEITLSTATDAVREGQIVEITATIKNTGDTDIENAKLKAIAPDGTVHTELPIGERAYVDSDNPEKIIDVGTIKAGETATVRYELRVEKPEIEYTTGEYGQLVINGYRGDREVENVVSLTADNITGEIKGTPYKFTITEGELEIVNISNADADEVLRKGRIVEYTIDVKNISYDKHLNNVTLNMSFPEGISIKSVEYLNSDSKRVTDGVNIDGNNVSVNVGKLNSMTAYIYDAMNGESSGTDIAGDMANIRTSTYVYVKFEVEDFKGDLTSIVTATADGIEPQYSNVRRYVTDKIDLSIVQEELSDIYIKEGTEYSYHFRITNNSETASMTNKMKMTLPEGLTFVEATYTNGEDTGKTTNSSNGTFTVDISEIAGGATVEVDVKVRADLLPDENDREVKTSATVEAFGFDPVTSNEVTAIIEYDPNADHSQGGGNQGGSGSNKPNRYKITGTAWIDENVNGERETSEAKLENIEVLLLNKDLSAIVTDPDSGEQKRTKTSSTGKYTFSNLPNGEYVVVFVYDSSNYTLTEYQKEGVNERFNSDAIDVNITVDGERRLAGMTDVLKVNGENIRDIDLGVYTANRFDLRLDKYVSKITLTTPTIGTRVDEYDTNTTLGKVEVLERNVGQSSAVIEYKIVVKNEGSVPGYANKIVDYLPDNVNFSTELNPDWYLSDNGNIYNSTLAEQVINPGETKELTLVVSINITDNMLGILDNNAEIYESYNEMGLEDVDSTVNNKDSSEDDMGKAEVVVGIVTGAIIKYTAITLVVITMLGLGIFGIKKFILNKKK